MNMKLLKSSDGSFAGRCDESFEFIIDSSSVGSFKLTRRDDGGRCLVTLENSVRYTRINSKKSLVEIHVNNVVAKSGPGA